MSATSPRLRSPRPPILSRTAFTPKTSLSNQNSNEDEDEEFSININGKREATKCEGSPRKSPTRFTRTLSEPHTISNQNDRTSPETEMYRPGQDETLVNLRWPLDFKERSATSNIEYRLRSRVEMAPLGVGLETFKSLKVLMGIFKDIVHIIKMLWQAGAMHGDINLRDILIDEREGQAQGILLDFGYAAPVVADKSSSSSAKSPHSNGTLPFVAANDLNDEPSISHTYFHELESLFYVLCWISTLYAGPCVTNRTFSKCKISYSKTTVAYWNSETTNNKRSIYRSKYAATRGMLENLKEFSPYFRHIDDCMESLCTLLFHAPIGDDKDREKKEQLKASLTIAYNDRDYSDYADFVKRFKAIPVSMRPPEIVLDSFTFALSKMESELPEDETALMEDLEESEEEESEEEDEIPVLQPRRFYFCDYVDNSGYDGTGPREIIPRRVRYMDYI